MLITASAVVYMDHLALGVWFPLSVYGVPQASLWRSVEHAVWVIFEDVFLVMSCRQGIEELSGIAEREVRLHDTADQLQQSNREILAMSKTPEGINQALETRVAQRTEELRKAKDGLEEEVKLRTAELQAAKESLEQEVDHRTAELKLAKERLEQHVQELEALNRIMMGREERILDLKDEIRALRARDSARNPPTSPDLAGCCFACR